MDMETELFILFPENKEAPTQTCAFTENADGWEESDFKSCFGMVLELKNTFHYERFLMFFDLNNIQAFCYPHLNQRHSLFNRKYVLLTLLKGMRNWRNQSEQQGESCVLHGSELGVNAVSEVAIRGVNHSENSYALVDCMALVSGCVPCVVSVNGQDMPMNVLGLEESQFYRWFCSNRKPERKYNWNPKHGKHGAGNWRGESRLLGSSDEAEQLLKYAIGESYQGTLYCWDAKYGHYMEYKNELNDTYHSFHLEGEDERRIPSGLKRFIDRLQKQQS